MAKTKKTQPARMPYYLTLTSADEAPYDEPATAQEELKERLNLRLAGVNPGQPYHWEGLHA